MLHRNGLFPTHTGSSPQATEGPLFPDSGRAHVALHEAEPDPNRKFQDATFCH